MNFSLYSDSDGDVLFRVLCGKANMTQPTPDTTLSKQRELSPRDSNKVDIIPKTLTITQHKDITLSTSTAPNPTLVPGTGNVDVNITEPLGQQSRQNCIIATIQEKIKNEIRKKRYKIEIAPSDLTDFGGQRSFDMTHQLFIRHKGTFVLMFKGNINISDNLPEYDPGVTTECKLVSDFLNPICFAHLTRTVT